MLDVDVKPNRGDALSLVGLAREVAAVTGAPVRFAGDRSAGGRRAGRRAASRSTSATRGLCPRFVGRWVEGVDDRAVAGPGPDAPPGGRHAADQQRRRCLQLRDARARQADPHVRRRGRRGRADGRAGSIVRRAEPGERLETLDHVERDLDPDTLAHRRRARARSASPGSWAARRRRSRTRRPTSSSSRRSSIRSRSAGPASATPSGPRPASASRRARSSGSPGSAPTAPRGSIAEWAGGTVARGRVDTRAGRAGADARSRSGRPGSNRLLGTHDRRRTSSGRSSAGSASRPRPPPRRRSTITVVGRRRSRSVDRRRRRRGARRRSSRRGGATSRSRRTSPRRSPASAATSDPGHPARHADAGLPALAARGPRRGPRDARRRRADRGRDARARLAAPRRGVPLGVAAADGRGRGARGRPPDRRHEPALGRPLDAPPGARRQPRRGRRRRTSATGARTSPSSRSARATARRGGRPARASGGGSGSRSPARGEPPAWNRPARPSTSTTRRARSSCSRGASASARPSYAPRARRAAAPPGPRRARSRRRRDGRLGLAGVVGELHPRARRGVGPARRPGRRRRARPAGPAAAGSRPVVTAAPPPRYPADERDLAVVVAEDAAAGGRRGDPRAAAARCSRTSGCSTSTAAARSAPDEKSLAYRLAFRAPDRTLTDAEIDAAIGGDHDGLRRESAAGSGPESGLRPLNSRCYPVRAPSAGPDRAPSPVRRLREHRRMRSSTSTGSTCSSCCSCSPCSCSASCRGRSAGCSASASMLFSFLARGATCATPLGEFLAAQLEPVARTSTRSCSGSAIVFVAATSPSRSSSRASTTGTPLFQKYHVRRRDPRRHPRRRPGAFLVGCIIVILDSFFLIPTIATVGRRAAVPARTSSRSSTSRATADLPDPADPGLLRRLRPADPGRPPGVLLHRLTPAPAELSDLSRDALRAADPRGRAGAARRCASSATSGRRGRPGRPDRRGRGVHRRGRPRLARPVRADRPQRGHVRASGHRLRVPCLRDVRLPERRHRARRPAGGGARPRRRADRGRRRDARRAARWRRAGARGAATPSAARARPRLDALPAARWRAGPGLVAAAFDIDRADDRRSTCSTRRRRSASSRGASAPAPTSWPRRGSGSATPASRGASRPWRFVDAGQPVGLRSAPLGRR